MRWETPARKRQRKKLLDTALSLRKKPPAEEKSIHTRAEKGAQSDKTTPKIDDLASGNTMA